MWHRVAFWSALVAAVAWTADLVPALALRHWELATRDGLALLTALVSAYVSRELLHSGTSR